MMLNADIRNGGEGLVKCGHLLTEAGDTKRVIFADVLYGRPLKSIRSYVYLEIKSIRSYVYLEIHSLGLASIKDRGIL